MSTAGSPTAVTGTSVDAGTPARAAVRERRAWERYLLTETTGKIIYRQMGFPCEFRDISLGGCRVRTEQRFVAGALAKVDVLLELHGIAQRIGGMTQWTGKDNQLGIRFVHASPQTKNEFAALLSGLIDAVAAEAVKEAVKEGVAVSAVAADKAASLLLTAGSAQLPVRALLQSGAPEVTAIEPEQRESQAVIRFLKDGSEMAGDVVDLSMAGCTLRMVRPFTLGIYVRVEVTFHVRGLVFQLAGVSQEIHDKCTVGFRFLDVSRRRGEELAQAIGELRALKEKQVEPG